MDHATNHENGRIDGNRSNGDGRFIQEPDKVQRCVRYRGCALVPELGRHARNRQAGGKGYVLTNKVDLGT